MSRKHYLFDEDPFFCDGECEGCILSEDDCDGCNNCICLDGSDEEADDDFDPEEELLKRLIRIKDQWMDVEFKPCHGSFDYLDGDPSDEDLAMEIGRLTFISSFTALMVLKAENAVFRAADEYYLDKPALATAVSFLTDIEETTVAGVLTASDIIYHLIDISIEDEKANGRSSKCAKAAQKGAKHE